MLQLLYIVQLHLVTMCISRFTIVHKSPHFMIYIYIYISIYMYIYFYSMDPMMNETTSAKKESAKNS